MSTVRKSLLIHCRRPPYGNSLAREAIDLALAAAAFDQAVTLLFSGDGVWQLLPDQHPGELGAKNHAGLLQSLPLYDIDRLYVAGSDLQQRGLDPDRLAVAAIAVQDEQLRELISHADQVFNF